MWYPKAEWLKSGSNVVGASQSQLEEISPPSTAVARLPGKRRKLAMKWRKVLPKETETSSDAAAEDGMEAVLRHEAARLDKELQQKLSILDLEYEEKLAEHQRKLQERFLLEASEAFEELRAAHEKSLKEEEVRLQQLFNQRAGALHEEAAEYEVRLSTAEAANEELRKRSHDLAVQLAEQEQEIAQLKEVKEDLLETLEWADSRSTQAQVQAEGLEERLAASLGKCQSLHRALDLKDKSIALLCERLGIQVPKPKRRTAEQTWTSWFFSSVDPVAAAAELRQQLTAADAQEEDFELPLHPAVLAVLRTGAQPAP